MANEGGGGKLKNKRNHGSKPYDRPKSLLRRVTEVVKEIFLPSFMFTSEPATQDVEEQEVTGTSSQEELNRPSSINGENREFSRPVFHSLKDKISEPVLVSQQRLTPLIREPRELPKHPASVPNFQTSSLTHASEFGRLENSLLNYSSRIETSEESRNNITHSNKDVITDNHSDCSDNSVSTSGCSSMIPHPTKQEYQKDVLGVSDSPLNSSSNRVHLNVPTARPPLHSINTSIKRQNTSNTSEFNASLDVPNSEQNHSRTNRSLWSEGSVPHSIPQARAYGKKPQFNASALGSLSLNNRSLLTDFNSSSYYSGKTAYGGASSYQKPRVHASSPYMSSHLANRQKIKVKTVHSDSNNIETMSSTARRILESIEKMSTPLRDAQRIPSGNSYLDSPLLFPLASAKRQSNISQTANNLSNPSGGPPVSKLLTPAAMSVAKNIHNVRSSEVNDSRGIPDRTQPSESLPATSAPLKITSDNQKNKGGGKMQTQRREALHYSSKSQQEEEEEEEVAQLPSIPLPITNLPKFNFGKVDVPVSTMKTNGLKNEYTFSSPLSEKSAPTGNRSPVVEKEENGFIFSKPLNTVKENSDSAQDSSSYLSNSTLSSSVPVSLNFQFQAPSLSPQLQLKTKQNKNGEKDSDRNEVIPSTELRSGSVMDILSKTPITSQSKETPSTVGFGDKFAPPPGNWCCSVCLINNKADAAKCAACENPRPQQQESKEMTKPVNEKVSSDFGEKFKPPSGSWPCPTCLINNKAEAEKCAACETPKPGAKKHPSPMNNTNTWGDVFKPPADSWQCDTCLVRNNATATKCISCDTKKAGTISTSGPSFKFGFPATTTTGSVFKMPLVPPASVTSTKSSSSESSGFVFGEQKPSTAPKATFKFGFGTNSSDKTVASLSTETIVTTSTKTVSTFSIFNSTANVNASSVTTSDAPAVVPTMESLSDSTRTEDKGSKVSDSSAEQEVPSSSQPFSSNAPSYQFNAPALSPKPVFTENTEKDDKQKQQSSSGLGIFQIPAMSASSNIFGKTEDSSTSQQPSTGGFVFSAKQAESVPASTVSQDSGAKTGGFLFNMQSSQPSASTIGKEDSSQTSSTTAAFDTSKPSGGFTFSFDKQKPSGKHPRDENETNEPSAKLSKSSATTTPQTVSANIFSNNLRPLPASSEMPFSFGAPSSCTTSTSTNVMSTIASQLPPMWATTSTITSSHSSTPSATSTSASLFGGITSTATGSSLFGGIKSRTNALSGTSTTTTTSSVGTLPVFNTGPNSPMVLSPTTTATPILFGMNNTSTSSTLSSLGSATTTTTNTTLPAFGSFQLPISTSASTATSNASLTFGGGAPSPFTFGAPTSTVPAFGGSPFNNINSSTLTAPVTTSTNTINRPSFSSTGFLSTTTTTAPSLFSSNTTSNFSASTNTPNLFTFGTQNTGNTALGSNNLTFGTPVTTVSNLSFGNASTFSTPAQPLPSFGNFNNTNPPNAVNTNPAPPFGSNTGFNFNSTPSFQFGNQPSSGIFTFTGNQANTTPQENSLFTFGQQQPQQPLQQQPQQQQPASAPAQPAGQNFQFNPTGFNFSAGGNAAPSSFQFGVIPQNSTNRFDGLGSNTSQTSQRLIRRAVRRTRK